jgi:glycine hydroxymethyltransferase
MGTMSKILELIKKEEKRQKNVINLIASENFVSKDVLKALGSVFTNKYSEGKSHQRYYHGNEFVDQLEDEVIKLAHKAFKVKPADYGINVQAYAGSIANLAVYFALLGPGDRILAMSLEHGGHLTHGHKVTMTSRIFKFKHYGVGTSGFIDYEEVARLAREFKPKLIICGASAYPRTIDFKKFGDIAKESDALLMADISHIAGLVIGGAHPSPFPYADVVTTTTQKTMRGPRGAIIITRKKLSDAVDRSVFPGLQGGPHINTIAAIGVALEEANATGFKKYSAQVVKNAKKLASEMAKLGFKIISGGTDNHLFLVDVSVLGISGKEAGEKLEKAGIIVNKNMIPYDTRKPWDPSGIRLGTPAVTTQGMNEDDMIKIAKRIKDILSK